MQSASLQDPLRQSRGRRSREIRFREFEPDEEGDELRNLEMLKRLCRENNSKK